MNKKIIFIVLFFYSLTVMSQQKIIQKSNTMEKLDINNSKIKSLKKNEKFIEKEGDLLTSFLLTSDDYHVTKYIEKSPYKAKKVFFLNGSIKIENYYFYNVPIGKLKKFNQSGLLIEEIDWNKIERRTFTIEQLIEKMNDEFNINLLDIENKNVSRSTVPFTYIITIGNPAISSKVRRIILNGEVGSTLSDEEIIYTK